MANLTLAELMQYPGLDLTEKAHAAHTEERAFAPLALKKPRAIARSIDVRAFPGRTRLERTMNYLRAHFPRAQGWSDDSLAELASALIERAEIVD